MSESAERQDIPESLNREADAGWAKIGVVVCGPGGLPDEARAAVVAAAENKREVKVVFDLEVDAYSC